MGLPDSALGAAMGGGPGQSSGHAALVNAAVQMIGNKSRGAGGPAGWAGAFNIGR